MRKKAESNPDRQPERPSKKNKGENRDKSQPHPDDPNEEKGPPIKEMPIKSD